MLRVQGVLMVDLAHMFDVLIKGAVGWGAVFYGNGWFVRLMMLWWGGYGNGWLCG